MAGDGRLAVALGDGRADRALTAGQSEELLEHAVRLDESLQGHRPGRLVAMSEELARSEVRPVLETLSIFYRNVAVQSLGLPQLLRLEHEAVIRTAEVLSADRAAARVERIHETLDALDWNANPSTTLDGLLYDLAAI